MRSNTEKKLRAELKVYKDAYKKLYKTTTKMVKIATVEDPADIDDKAFRKAYIEKNKAVFEMIDTVERYKSQKEAA